MTKTIVGLFDSLQEAQNTVEDLLRFGISRDDLSMVARDEHGSADRQREVGATTAESAGVGAIGGSLVGGAFGLLVGAGLLVVPGIGPVLAAGPLAAALGTTALGAGLGAAAGGLLGGLMGAGVPEEEARSYVEGVRRGGTLLSVEVVDHSADDVHQIMLRNGAIDLDSRVAEWRNAGWDTQGVDGFAVGNLVVDAPITREDAPSASPSAATGSAAPGARMGPPPQSNPERTSEVPASDLNSESTRRAPHFAGADAMGGAISGMQGGSGSAQPGARASSQEPDQPSSASDLSSLDTARAGHPEAISEQNDNIRDQRDPADDEAAFLNHYQQWIGVGGQPYDYYKPGHQFGYDLAGATGQRYSVWSEAERDARQAWEREARGSWEEFKQAIRFGWEKARGHA
jgi:uncharacterized membrane protein